MSEATFADERHQRRHQARPVALEYNRCTIIIRVDQTRLENEVDQPTACVLLLPDRPLCIMGNVETVEFRGPRTKASNFKGRKNLRRSFNGH